MRKASVELLASELNKKEILRYLGHRNQEVSENVEAILNETMEECVRAASPVYVWEEFDLEFLEDGVRLQGTDTVLFGKSITRHLKKAKKAVVLAATLGAKAEQYLKILSYNNMTKTVMADSVFTQCIEQVCDTAEEEIKKYAAEKGYKTNFRFSPGYGDLSIEIQPKILGILNTARTIGLSCSRDFLMIPRKSVSAIIGFLPQEETAAEEKQGCESCEMNDRCNFKKAGEQMCK